MDSIPKEGGNRFSGGYRYFFSSAGLQNENIPDDLRQYIREGDELRTSWNHNMALGGPVVENRLWFFTAFRILQNDSYVADSPIPGPGGRTMRLPNGDRVNRDSRIAPNGQLRLTGSAVEPRQGARRVLQLERPDAALRRRVHGDERQSRVVRRA